MANNKLEKYPQQIKLFVFIMSKYSGFLGHLCNLFKKIT